MKYGIVRISPLEIPIFDQNADPYGVYWDLAAGSFSGIMDLSAPPVDPRTTKYHAFPREMPSGYDYTNAGHIPVLVCCIGPLKAAHCRAIWGTIPIKGPLMICGETAEKYLVPLPEDEAAFYMRMYYSPERIRKKRANGRLYGTIEYIR